MVENVYTLVVSSRVLNYLSDLVDIDDDSDETFRPLSVRQDACVAIADAFNN